jgi:hypothetical protein
MEFFDLWTKFINLIRSINTVDTFYQSSAMINLVT